MNKIEEVVLPLKNDAMDRAEQHAWDVIAVVAKKLWEADWDAEKVAPYPDSWRMSKEQYHEGMREYKKFRAFVSHDKGSRRSSEPELVTLSIDRMRHFVEAARDNAAAQYDSFVTKLNMKIGEVTEAKLEGNHVWGYSHLLVTKADGTKEIWKTQMIINVSKLGLVFNQFPTRKVKGVF